MKRFPKRVARFMIASALVAPLLLAAQTTPPPSDQPAPAPVPAPSSKPQTARQALIEFLFSSDHEKVARHYPEVAKKAFHHIKDDLGELTMRDFFSLTSDLRHDPKKTQTFDEGPVLASMREADGQVTGEIDVGAEEDRPGEDQFELAILSYKDGKPEATPGILRLTVLMRQEKKIWRMADMKLSLDVPLDDPDFLKGQVSDAKEKRKDDNAGAAVMTVRQIVTAETAYAEDQPKLGYTCSLPDLVTASAQWETNQLNANLASAKVSGYIFKLRACGTPPANNYQVTAEPESEDDGTTAYCSDESGPLRYSDEGSGAECLSIGQNVDKPVQPPTESPE